MTTSIVLNGAYKNYGIHSNITSTKLLIQKWGEKHYIDDTTVKSYEILDKGESKSSLGKTIGLGILFGGAGALVGANSKKAGSTTIRINWKDGEKSIIELTPDDFKTFLKVCPL